MYTNARLAAARLGGVSGPSTARPAGQHREPVADAHDRGGRRHGPAAAGAELEPRFADAATGPLAAWLEERGG